jgi:formamidopyrimidine-DNA glycosylase
MPELPEVETIKNDLTKIAKGEEFSGIEVLVPKMFTWGKFLENDLVGAKIEGLRRRGKILILDLDRGLSLVFHLKLTGQIIFQDGVRIAGGHPVPPLNTPVPNSTTHIIFSFKSGAKLYFNDLRKFGWVKFLETGEVGNLPAMIEYGPEPLSPEFTLDYLKSVLKKRPRMPIKQVLMDQKLIAGIGNIYAAESLFLAKIRPQRKAGEVTEEEAKRLYESILEALKVAIAHRGSSSATFVGGTGERGMHLDYAYVYNRESEPCKVCKTPIKKERLGGRGTYYCPHCQK